LSFTQESDESLIPAWERFDTLVRSSPSLSILDPILLQYFYMGLNRETTTFLNLASNGSFLHTPATKARELSLNLSQITPTYEAKPPQELVEKQIAEPEFFPNPYQHSAIIPNTGETLVLANVFEFEDEYFSEFGNTLNYHLIRKPQKSKPYPEELLLNTLSLQRLRKI
jgi:hypothetical protein